MYMYKSPLPIIIVANPSRKEKREIVIDRCAVHKICVINEFSISN